jgi:hypothetical protein
MKLFSMILVALGILLRGASNADAGVIYSNLGPGGTFNTNAAYGIGFGTVVAMGFTPTRTATFGDAQLPLAFGGGGGPNLVVISLETDAGGVPGAILEQITVTGLGSFPPGGFLTTAHSTLHPVLTAGVPYWIVASTTPTSGVFWNLTSPTTFSNGSNFAYNFSGSATGPWSTGSVPGLRSAFQVDDNLAAITPEPSALALLVSGLICSCGHVRRRDLKFTCGLHRSCQTNRTP